MDEGAGQKLRIAVDTHGSQCESGFDVRGAFVGELAEVDFACLLGIEDFSGPGIGNLAVDQVDGLMQISQSILTVDVCLHAT